MKRLLFFANLLLIANSNAMFGGFPEEAMIQRYKGKLKCLEQDKKRYEEKIAQATAKMDFKENISTFFRWQTVNDQQQILSNDNTLTDWTLKELCRHDLCDKATNFFQLAIVSFCNEHGTWQVWCKKPYGRATMGSIGGNRYEIDYGTTKNLFIAQAFVNKDGTFIKESEPFQSFHKYTTPDNKHIFIPNALFPFITNQVRNIFLEANLIVDNK